MLSGKIRTLLGSESVDHKQKKDLQKKTERKRNNKDKKQSEKTQELEEAKGTTRHSSRLVRRGGVHSLDGGIAFLVFFPLVTGDS